MTSLAAILATLLATGALATGGLIGDDGRPAPSRTAVVIDASAARDGRALIDRRLRGLDADVRAPRTATEARTDVRYFAAQGYDRVIAVGPHSQAAVRAARVPVTTAADLSGALTAAQR